MSPLRMGKKPTRAVAHHQEQGDMMLISVGHAAKKLKTKANNVYYLIAMGELSGYKVRWIWRLWEKEVDEYALCRSERRAGKTATIDS